MFNRTALSTFTVQPTSRKMRAVIPLAARVIKARPAANAFASLVVSPSPLAARRSFATVTSEVRKTDVVKLLRVSRAARPQLCAPDGGFLGWRVWWSLYLSLDPTTTATVRVYTRPTTTTPHAR